VSLAAAPVLTLDRVSFTYGATPVLDDVSLTVASGEFVALIGPNGAGKSALLGVGAGLLHPTRGQVELFGTPIERFRSWARIGLVPQRSAQQRTFPATVAEVVTLGRAARHGLFWRQDDRDRRSVSDALELLGSTHLRTRLIGELSGGEFQRVMIARALAGEPDLLLLDEPTTGMDAASTEALIATLARLRAERGVSILYVSHELESIWGQMTRVVALNRRVLFAGDPAEWRERAEATPEVAVHHAQSYAGS
jgi:zinc transport system ATP-binding protein